VIHVGLAADRGYFAIERGAARDGYDQYPDEARRVFTRAESKAAWGKSPERLESSIDIEDVVKRWKKLRQGVDVRASDDVGNYLCGFSYYLSLERFWKAGGERPVFFFHVPPLSSQKDVEEGVETTIALIQAVVASVEG
jgi:pyroglutamyl-peptidase